MTYERLETYAPEDVLRFVTDGLNQASTAAGILANRHD